MGMFKKPHVVKKLIKTKVVEEESPKSLRKPKALMSSYTCPDELKILSPGGNNKQKFTPMSSHHKHFSRDSDREVEELFAEKFIKVSFRDYSNNTRMDIKNVDHRSQQIKRDRMMHYWHNNVVENFLPPIDPKRR
jgi:hypothetical protein